MAFKSDKKEPEIAGIKLHIFLNSLFFLFLGVSSNFIGDTFGTNLQKLFNDSIICKQVIILITIYFGLDLSSESHLNPFNSIKASLIIYLIFTIISNLDYRVSVSMLSLLTLIYFESNYKSYEVKNNRMTQEKFDFLVKIRRTIMSLLLIAFIIGIGLFFKDMSVTEKIIKLIPESISR